MPFIANSYNYATPLSSATGLLDGAASVADLRYFTLADNILDGSYRPVSGDVGIWSADVSNADGTLNEPFVLTVSGSQSLNAVRIVGSQYSYPVAFSVDFYNGDTAVYSFIEESNSHVEYIRYLGGTIDITSYVITITKISEGGVAARLYNVGPAVYVKRYEDFSLKATATSGVGSTSQLKVNRTDRFSLVAREKSRITNTINKVDDPLPISARAVGTLTNVHTRMKEPTRRIYGKVYVTYSDPMLDSENNIASSGEAYNSDHAQLMDDVKQHNDLLFTLYDNDLSGRYHVMSTNSQVGWVSDVVSNEDGSFDSDPFVTINFAARPIISLTMYFDGSHGSVPVDLTVLFRMSNGEQASYSVVDNYDTSATLSNVRLANVESITVTVHRVSMPGHPATILELPVMSTILYEGYRDSSNLLSIDLLEELTYDDTVEALGGMSANEATVVFDNSEHVFDFNSPNSIVAQQLKRNRKVVPWLGVEIVPGSIEWYQLGVFWSYRWNVPVNGMKATVAAFDTIGLLDTAPFENHQVLMGRSIGQLIDYVLTDAKRTLSFLKWRIDPALYDVVIPYAWFEADSYAAALRRISMAYPMHIYCDREGVICAAPQKLHLDYYYDTWSDSTNVIGKEYSTLYTTLPNIINVTVSTPHVIGSDVLVNDYLTFAVPTIASRTLVFTRPYVDGFTVELDADASVSYTYDVFSWGVRLRFTGSGEVRGITCRGTSVDTSNTAVLTSRNEESIFVDGAIKRDISAPFIQTVDQANLIISRILELSEYDKYDASVTYRGDIALSINDPIRLLDGIAPDNRYNIRRHQLSWNGALTGTADINT